jgi:hypothetical protein
MAAFDHLGLEMGAALGVVLGLVFLVFRQNVWLIANISVVEQ